MKQLKAMTTVENIELGSDSLLSKFNVSHLMKGRDFEEVYFDSPYGRIQVIIQGRKGSTAFVTFHDLGLNGRVQFCGFFASEEMEKIMQHFCVYHITAPGQQENAQVIPADAKYPTMDEMADIVEYAIGYFKLNRVIGFGIGLGAHVIAKTAQFYSNRFTAIVTINCQPSACTWMEWANMKLMRFHLRHNTIDAAVVNSLLQYHLGYEVMNAKPDLVRLYSEYFEKSINPINFQRLLDSFASRTALTVDREDALECAVMNVVGDFSPHMDEVVEFNGRLNPQNSTFVKLADCGGLVLDEQPDKFAETLMYFLQGLGYVVNLSVSQFSLANRMHHRIMSERISSSINRNRSKTSFIPRRGISPDLFVDSAKIPKEV